MDMPVNAQRGAMGPSRALLGSSAQASISALASGPSSSPVHSIIQNWDNQQKTVIDLTALDDDKTMSDVTQKK